MTRRESGFPCGTIVLGLALMPVIFAATFFGLVLAAEAMGVGSVSQLERTMQELLAYTGLVDAPIEPMAFDLGTSPTPFQRPARHFHRNTFTGHDHPPSPSATMTRPDFSLDPTRRGAVGSLPHRPRAFAASCARSPGRHGPTSAAAFPQRPSTPEVKPTLATNRHSGGHHPPRNPTTAPTASTCAHPPAPASGGLLLWSAAAAQDGGILDGQSAAGGACHRHGPPFAPPGRTAHRRD
jgi:hypothetical protein